MTATAWTPALDVFEDNLRRMERALADDVAWEELALTPRLPVTDEVGPSADERTRLVELRERAAIVMTEVQRKMDAIRTEQLASDTKVAAARTYGRGF